MNQLKLECERPIFLRSDGNCTGDPGQGADGKHLNIFYWRYCTKPATVFFVAPDLGGSRLVKICQKCYGEKPDNYKDYERITVDEFITFEIMVA